MIINIYKDPMQKADLFGTPVLYNPQSILGEDVPQGWCCYALLLLKKQGFSTPCRRCWRGR